MTIPAKPVLSGFPPQLDGTPRALEELKLFLAPYEQWVHAWMEDTAGILYRGWLSSPDETVHAFSHPDPEVRCAAVCKFTESWIEYRPGIEACLIVAEQDSDLQARQNAIAALGTCAFHHRGHPAIERALVRLFRDEAEPAAVRREAYRSLAFISLSPYPDCDSDEEWLAAADRSLVERVERELAAGERNEVPRPERGS